MLLKSVFIIAIFTAFANLASPKEATPANFAQLEQMFNDPANKAPVASTLNGWFSGQCYSSDQPQNTVGAAELFIGEYEQSTNVLRSTGVYDSASGNPHLYDNLSPDQIRDIANSIKPYEPLPAFSVVGNSLQRSTVQGNGKSTLRETSDGTWIDQRAGNDGPADLYCVYSC